MKYNVGHKLHVHQFQWMQGNNQVSKINLQMSIDTRTES